MNMYLKLLKAKEGDNKAFENIIKTYEVFANIQMKKYGVRDIESCYSDIIMRIYESVINYKLVTVENNWKIA